MIHERKNEREECTEAAEIRSIVCMKAFDLFLAVVDIWWTLSSAAE